MFYNFVTKHAYDRQSDRQTELRSQDRASIAASRGKNIKCFAVRGVIFQKCEQLYYLTRWHNFMFSFVWLLAS